MLRRRTVTSPLLVRIGASVVAVALAVGCVGPTAVSHSCEGMANDHVTLVDRLRCGGMNVDIAGPADLPYLKGHGTTLRVKDGGVRGEAQLLCLSYTDEDLGADGRTVAASDAAKFERNGSPKTPGAVTYTGTPHLFLRERALVIYSGDDRIVVDALTRMLGPQFAGT